MKEHFISLLKMVNREGIDELIDCLEQGGFFESPCSGGNHLAKLGGLVEHSINVHDIAIELAETLLYGELAEEYPQESVILCALLHDVGKMGQFGKSNYIPNILKSGKISESKPFETNKDLIYEEHEIRSVVTISKFIDLTEAEQNAILHHNGLWGKLDSSFGSSFDKNPLAMIIHFADLWASRVKEE